ASPSRTRMAGLPTWRVAGRGPHVLCSLDLRNVESQIPSMTTPLVTIGIPCYNSARSLPAAISSALNQNGVECEVIVVDDGSTDTSLVIASAYGERVNLIRTSHCGANHA